MTSRFTTRHEFSKKERLENTMRAHYIAEGCKNKKNNRIDMNSTDLHINHMHACAEKLWSRIVHTPYEFIWDKYGFNNGVRHYNVETPKHKIKIAYTHLLDGDLFINYNHLPKLDADIYVQVVGTEDIMEFTGWAYTEEFFKNPIRWRIYNRSYGAVPTIKQYNLREFFTLREILKRDETL